MRIGVICVIKEAWGGSEELWAAMAHEAIGQGHEVVVSAYNCGEVHPKMQTLISKGLKLVYRRGYVRPGLPVWKRIMTKAVVLMLNKINNPFSSFLKLQPDFTLYNGTSYTCVEDISFFKKMITDKGRYFYLSHIAADYYRPIGLSQLPILKEAFKNSVSNLFVAQRTINVTQRQIGYSIPNKHIVRNPVNLKNIAPVRFPALDGTVRFATVGLLVAAHKGQDMLFETLSSDIWQKRDWHLNIYGSGIDENFLKQLAAFYQISEKVTFHGKVANIEEIWKLNHMLLMPSLMEGMPLAIIEAMLCARPCMATDVGDHTTWIEDGKEGFIAEAPSPTSIHKALEHAWQEMESWEEMGIKAYEKAISMYEKEPGKKLLSLLTNI